MLRKTSFHLICLIVVSLFISCAKKNNQSISRPISKVQSFHLSEIRLGDGVPLSLNFSIRWTANDAKSFLEQYDSAEAYKNLILNPRSIELASTISHEFESVDSVFSTQRQTFLNAMKAGLIDDLGATDIKIQEVIVSKLNFPKSYTDAMEKAGLQKQELERIRQQNILDIERASADRKKAEAVALVEMAKAEATAKVQSIQAKTERNRRDSELAKAETAAQIAERQAIAEAERQKLLDKADLAKQTDLKNLEIQKQRDLMNLDLEKSRLLDKAAMDREIELAKVFQENPVYASFVVNKELASKVEIAVLPSGTDSNVFGTLLNQSMKNNNDK